MYFYPLTILTNYVKNFYVLLTVFQLIRKGVSMKKLFILVMAILVILPAASMAGIYPGFGVGLNVGGGTSLLPGGHFGFKVAPMLGIVVEGFYLRNFTAHTNGIVVGGGTDIFILGFTHHKLLIDPYVYGRGGYMRFFGDFGGNLGYIRFGGGVPFNLGTIQPYAEIGAFITLGGGGSQGSFNLAGGLRFNL